MTAEPGSGRIRLVVLFGGQSAEHEVSLVTARHVLAATDTDRYDVQPVAITPSGQWVVAEEAARALAAGPDALPDALAASGPEISPLPAVARHDDQPVVVLPLLHGPLGEDGTVQGLLELADVAYVGAGVLASALAMDKAKAKEVCGANGIPQARYRALHERDMANPTCIPSLIDELGLPLFVKPANMGSSVGVSKARDLAELTDALRLAATFDEWIVVEEMVDGREIECGVLGNLDPRSSVVGEIVPGSDFYDYNDKYVDGRVQIVIPADLPASVSEHVRTLAVDAFRALRCEGMARVDFFYDEAGRGVLLNEVNTIPGFTPASMFPKLWEASGLAYPALIDELVGLALERHARRLEKRRKA
jgi:D-alanine-D-alanine ligase